jgi:lambda family phage portal protein
MKAFGIQITRTGKELKQHTVKPTDAALLRKAAEHSRRLPNGTKLRHSRMYDAATTTNLSQDFPFSITSSNAEIQTSISASRSRARRLVRDNPYGYAIEQSWCTNVAGDEPFRLEMKVGTYDATGKFNEDVDTNRTIEQAWKVAGNPENCCANRSVSRMEMYHMAIASVIRDGGILFRHRRLYKANKFFYAIEPIEYDRLDHFYNRPENTGQGNEIQFSIEMDVYHAPVAYWILTRHPGDIFAYSNQPKYRERVAAEDIIPVWNMRKRAGQYVGMSSFAPIIQRLHRLDQYDIMEVTAAVLGASKVGFFTKQNTTDEYTGDKQSEEGIKVDDVTPGIGFEELPEGYDVKPFDSTHPSDAYGPFTQQNLRAVAQGVGLANSTVSGDYAGMSFSTGRLEKLPERDNFKTMQEHLKKCLVHPHFNEWLKYAILSGSVQLPISRLEEFQNCAVFHAKRWPYINPLQDRQSDIIGIEAGLDSRSNVIAESERGGDVEQVDAEQSSDKAMDELHGLDFSNADPTIPVLESGDDAIKPASGPGGKQTLKKRSALNGWRHQRAGSYD